MEEEQPADWRDLASRQAGLLARRQLRTIGFDRWSIRNQVSAGRWAERSALVVSTTTGPLSREQTRWLGVLHAGPASLVGELSAAEVHGLQRWHREDITVMVPDELDVDDDVPGVRLVRTRRDLAPMRDPGHELPVSRLEPAILHFAAYDRSERTAQGALAAVVQQRLSTPELLLPWIRTMRPLRRAPLFRAVLADIAGGSQSVAELDVLRLCRDHRLEPPGRQQPRTDSSGRQRFTDCEWHLPDGRVVVLEIDGSFHMEAEQWEDDLVRALGVPRRVVESAS